MKHESKNFALSVQDFQYLSAKICFGKAEDAKVQNRKGWHTITRLTAHLVWATKYRYHVLQGDIKVRCRELLIQVCDVIVLLRAGNNDLRRITRQARVIDVDILNDEGLSNKSWRDYLTTADAIESALRILILLDLR